MSEAAAARIVAIVGRPNVGKSRLFNRIARRRISIVHDQPGVTRDIISSVIDDDFTLLDTGGLGLSESPTADSLIPAVEAQAQFAIEAAHVVVFVVDGREGLRPLDQKVAGILRKAGKKVIVVANKQDRPEAPVDMSDFYKLGFGEPIALSAEHGSGEAELRDAIAERLGPIPPEAADRTPEDPLKIAFVGRPNVGKSSLSNRLMRSNRLIVSEIPGTTRDAVEHDFTYSPKEGTVWKFRLVDTAGIRPQTKLSSSVEYFSRTRSLHAMQHADVVFVVLDAMDGVNKVDQAIAGEVVKLHKPVIVLVNKWDLVHRAFRTEPLRGYKSERDYREKYEHAIRQELFFTPGAPVIFVSALRGVAVDRMLKGARNLDRLQDVRIPTGQLNHQIEYLTDRTPPSAFAGKRFRAYYSVQTGTRPMRIKIFCNQERSLDESYRRYLEAGLVEKFKLDGCPILFDLIGKKKMPRPGFLPSED
ncbi:MAG TPA: ribosome biogenesis GTPase Der [Opitutaceae bacterium]